MSDQLSVPTSPELDTNSGLMNDAATFSGNLTLDMSDQEIQSAWRIIQHVRSKWTAIFHRKFNDPSTFKLDDALKLIDQFEDEIKTELAEKVNVLATVNVVPILEGQPLEIEFIGKLPGSDIYKYGMDHERKGWEVKRATASVAKTSSASTTASFSSRTSL
jgi:hypothetical protein